MCVAGTDWFTGKGLDGRQRAVYAVNNWDAPIYQLILGCYRPLRFLLLVQKYRIEIEYKQLTMTKKNT